jgi:hypothetical protein
MVTILDSPASGSSVQDDLWHIAVSDNSGSTDMRYVFDVYVLGQNVATVNQYPEPSNGKSYFNVGPIIRNSFTYTWFQPTATPGGVYIVEPHQSGEIAIQYQIQYGEDVSGETDFNQASAVTKVYNWRPNVFKRRVFGLNDMLNKFLSNRPRTIRASLNENILIPIYTQPKSLQLFVNTYNGANTLIGSYSGDTTAGVDSFYQLNIGTYAANYACSNEIINGAVKYYDVWFNDMEVIRVYLECNGEYEPVLIHFMNAWGMFETLKFGKVSRLYQDTERKGFSQRDYEFGSSVAYQTDNVYRESKINYGNKSSYYMKITADALTDEEYVWASELLMSPQVYAEIDGYYYPVTLRTNNYEYSKNINNRMRPLEIEIDLNQTRYAHQR